MTYYPCFSLAFVVHYVNGDTIQGGWNSNTGNYKGQTLTFSELCDLADISSVELLYRDIKTKTINRSILSVPKSDKKVKYIMLFRGMYSSGFSAVNTSTVNSYEKGNIRNPKYLVLPGAIQISLLALEVTEEVDSIVEAYKKYPVIAKLTLDTCGVFKNDSII